MAFELRYDSVFKEDYKREMREHPELRDEFIAAVRELASTGTVPAEYSPHRLVNTGGNYNNHMDFHLSDGAVDVVVLYLPHKTNPVIRFVRMGPHSLIFQGPLK
ncbi:MAG: type II toxin-antitoxin system YafQ family toxin [Eggerthellaceae bacterium]|nr:type II toxin-antitoxin system YafQ family toxin [Eggerthellaceae bacterium]